MLRPALENVNTARRCPCFPAWGITSPSGCSSMSAGGPKRLGIQPAADLENGIPQGVGIQPLYGKSRQQKVLGVVLDLRRGWV